MASQPILYIDAPTSNDAAKRVDRLKAAGLAVTLAQGMEQVDRALNGSNHGCVLLGPDLGTSSLEPLSYRLQARAPAAKIFVLYWRGASLSALGDLSPAAAIHVLDEPSQLMDKLLQA